MTCMRLTICRPSQGQEREVERLLHRLEEEVSKQEGYITGGYFQAAESHGEVGRFSIWKDRHFADHASSVEDVIALRSQLHLVIEPGHTEGLYEFNGPLSGALKDVTA